MTIRVTETRRINIEMDLQAAERLHAILRYFDRLATPEKLQVIPQEALQEMATLESQLGVEI